MGQISDQIINTTDLFATLASIIDFELPDEVAVDSYDMLPVLLGRQPADDLGYSPSVFGGILNCEWESGGFSRIADHWGTTTTAVGSCEATRCPKRISKRRVSYTISDPGVTRNLCNVELVKA